MACAWETVCARLSHAQAPSQAKPVCPNGYYNYQGVGDVKPDCVEVAVRELMDLLLWDPTKGRFDLDRLPADTVHPVLYELYNENKILKTIMRLKICLGRGLQSHRFGLKL